MYVIVCAPSLSRVPIPPPPPPIVSFFTLTAIATIMISSLPLSPYHRYCCPFASGALCHTYNVLVFKGSCVVIGSLV